MRIVAVIALLLLCLGATASPILASDTPITIVPSEAHPQMPPHGSFLPPAPPAAGAGGRGAQTKYLGANIFEGKVM